MRTVRGTALAVLVLLAAGCTYRTGEKFGVAQVEGIERGKTTKAWVLEKIGQPAFRSGHGSSEIWMYQYSEMPFNPFFPPGFFGSAKFREREGLTIVFEGDVVRDYTVHTGRPGGLPTAAATSRRDVPSARTQKDMDEVVTRKGIPRMLVEQSFSGGHVITLVFPDEMVMFESDAERTYTTVMSTTKVILKDPDGSPLKQETIPLWFKARYPNLDWSNVPTR